MKAKRDEYEARMGTGYETEGNTSANSQGVNSKFKYQCPQWKAGNCNKGKDCRFQHDDKAPVKRKKGKGKGKGKGE